MENYHQAAYYGYIIRLRRVARILSHTNMTRVLGIPCTWESLIIKYSIISSNVRLYGCNMCSCGFTTGFLGILTDQDGRRVALRLGIKDNPSCTHK